MIRFDHAVVACTRRSAVEGVSLEVPEGQALAVIGRSGAGKSLLLAATAAATPLSGGDITVHGRSVRHDPAGVRRSVGYAPARPPGWPPCTVGEFLELAARAVGLVGKPLRSALARALDVCDLGDRVASPVDTLPDGAARMLLVARALLHDPRVLVLDDPFPGLDPFQRDALERIIADAHLMGRTVLAAIDDAAVPSCFTHLAVLTDAGVTMAGPNAVEAFSTAGRFSYRLACPGRAEEAVRALLPLVADARALDLDHVQATIDPALVPGSGLVAAALAAGIPVEAAGFHPPWTAQLIR